MNLETLRLQKAWKFSDDGNGGWGRGWFPNVWVDVEHLLIPIMP